MIVTYKYFSNLYRPNRRVSTPAPTHFDEWTTKPRGAYPRRSPPWLAAVMTIALA